MTLPERAQGPMPERPAYGGPRRDAPAAGPRTPAAPSPGAGVYLRVPSMEAPVMERVRLLFGIFDGPCPVYFRAEDTGKMLRAPRTMWCDPNPVLLRELGVNLGDENVKKLD